MDDDILKRDVFSVRLRPQGPDYRCFVAKLDDGVFRCYNKECEVAQLARTRSHVAENCQGEI